MFSTLSLGCDGGSFRFALVLVVRFPQWFFGLVLAPVAVSISVAGFHSDSDVLALSCVLEGRVFMWEILASSFFLAAEVGL